MGQMRHALSPTEPPRMNTGQALIINVAPHGAYPQNSDHPAAPLPRDDVVATARSCLDAGASMLHLHIRYTQGRHSLDVHAYRDTLARQAAEAAAGLGRPVATADASRYLFATD
jgi:hypothetical protein